MLTGAIREIFRTNLGVKRNERVLIFTDRPTKKDRLSEEEIHRWSGLKDVFMLVVETGRSYAGEILNYTMPSRGGHGVEPTEGLWRIAFGEKVVTGLKEKGLFRSILNKRVTPEKLQVAEEIISKHRNDSVDVVIALSNYSTSHTRFRDFLTRICGTRYASMPLFDISMFEGAMDVDWRVLEKRAKAIAAQVKKAEELHITTPNGTDIKLSKRNRKVHTDTGNLRKAGAFGNLPAGEVFFAPLEGTANGRVVLEWAPTRRLSSPITLIVSDGVVREIHGKDTFALLLKDKLREKQENANIAELGIGVNERATRPDNILESEKILGTVHIALGDNSSFGGRVKTPFHLDFVFFHPTIKLKQKDSGEVILMKDGAFSP